MTDAEDEAWDEMQARQRQQRLAQARAKAVQAAERFCVEYRDDLHQFSIRKAFELGYMEAHKDE
jgi:hypothetical protein